MQIVTPADIRRCLREISVTLEGIGDNIKEGPADHYQRLVYSIRDAIEVYEGEAVWVRELQEREKADNG